MMAIAQHCPSVVLLQQTDSRWEQPGALPAALQRPFFARTLAQAISPNSLPLDRVHFPSARAMLSPLRAFAPRSTQHSKINDGSILFPGTF